MGESVSLLERLSHLRASPRRLRPAAQLHATGRIRAISA